MGCVLNRIDRFLHNSNIIRTTSSSVCRVRRVRTQGKGVAAKADFQCLGENQLPARPGPVVQKGEAFLHIMFGDFIAPWVCECQREGIRKH